MRPPVFKPVSTAWKSQKGLTLLEVLLAIVVIMVGILMVGSFVTTDYRSQLITDDALVLNRAVEDLAHRFAVQKLASKKTGKIVITREGITIDQETKARNPVGAKTYDYVASVSPVADGKIYVYVTLTGPKGVTVVASDLYQAN